MNKISMDALNRGWVIGIGTQIRAQDSDFEEALRRHEAAVAAFAQRPSPAAAVSRFAMRARQLLMLLWAMALGMYKPKAATPYGMRAWDGGNARVSSKPRFGRSMK